MASIQAGGEPYIVTHPDNIGKLEAAIWRAGGDGIERRDCWGNREFVFTPEQEATLEKLKALLQETAKPYLDEAERLAALLA
jgi:hypothetical protein